MYMCSFAVVGRNSNNHSNGYTGEGYWGVDWYQPHSLCSKSSIAEQQCRFLHNELVLAFVVIWAVVMMLLYFVVVVVVVVVDT